MEFVGEDGDASTGATGHETADLLRGRRQCGLRDSTTDLSADGIVRRGSKIFNLDADGTEVGEQSIFESSTEIISPGGSDDLYMFVGHCHIYRYSLVWDAAKE